MWVVISWITAAIVGCLLLFGTQGWPGKGKTYGLEEARSWLHVSIPLVWAGLAMHIQAKADLLMLGAMVGLEETGIYSAAARITILISYILGIVETAIAPIISRKFHSGQIAEAKALYIKATWISGVSGALLFFGIAIWRDSIMLLFGEDFLGGVVVFLILGAGQLVNSITGPASFMLMVSGGQTQYSYAMIVMGVLNIGLNFLLIPRFGIVGAAVATAVSLSVVNLSLVYFVAHKFHYGPFR